MTANPDPLLTDSVGETETAKLERLHSRLAAEHRRVILQAATADMLPPAGTLAHIANLESAIVATEAIIVEETSGERDARR